MVKNITDIINISEINNPNVFEKYFEVNYEKLPTVEFVTFHDKLIFNLLTHSDEVNFTSVYPKLSNIGLELLDYLNHCLFEYTFRIDDDRVKFWITYLYPEYKQMNFVLWYLQYKFKNGLLFDNSTGSIDLIDIPHFDWNKIHTSIEFISLEDKQVRTLFTLNKRGISLL